MIVDQVFWKIVRIANGRRNGDASGGHLEKIDLV
jgi:hypothetical protein